MHFDPDWLKNALSILNNEQVKNALSPTTKAMGENFKDLYNATVGENLHNVAEKLRERRRGKRDTNYEDFKQIMPLLQGASLEGDETLQDRWANLMDSAIDKTEGYLPSFGQTLSELSADEARYIDRLWAFFSQPLPINTGVPFAMWPVEEHKLIDLYDPDMPTGVNDAEIQVFSHLMSAEQIEGYARLNHSRLIIQDLIRLGILSQTQRAESRDHYFLNDTPMPMKGSPTVLKTEYALTHYGVSFIRAVTGKETITEKGGPHEAAPSE